MRTLLPDGPVRYVLQFDGPLDPGRRARLYAAGITLGDHLPTNAYIVTLDRAQRAATAKLDFIRWTGPFQSDWKLDSDLGAREFKTPARIALAERGLLRVVATLFAGEDADPAIEGMKGVGATILARTLVGDQWMIEADVPEAILGNLARVGAIQFIEEAPEGTFRNDTNEWIVQSNAIGYTPIWDTGLHGEGQIGGLIDGTINEAHCAFNDSVDPGEDHRKIIAVRYAGGVNSHGTHTAGTLAGDSGTYGAPDPYDGIAYAARISSTEVGSVYASPTTFYNRLVDAHEDGARVHSNSWGDDSTTSYTTWSRQIDLFSYDYEESLVAFAVTNDEYLKTPENAKNVLAVGATQDTPNQHMHCSGGTGPTADGRRKPEIYAPGCGTLSANSSTSCSVWAKTGTSMACPAIAGAGLLVRQYFVEGFYPTGEPTPGDALTPSGALLKAVLINGTVDMTGVSVSGYPSHKEGWGRLQLDSGLHFAGDDNRMYMHDLRNARGLSTAEDATFRVIVQNAEVPLRVTLVWTEPPASVNAADPVINKLDLKVESPGGAFYIGNWMSNGESLPGGAYDARNNVERVILSSPEIGTYTLTVKGRVVNVGRQGFALVATGDLVPDCNDNGVSDASDILGGSSVDCDSNNVPDECQSDFDADGTIDECDTDSDGDGVVNDDDTCAYTRPGTVVDENGRPISDTQGTCHVDLLDYWRFRACQLTSGPEIRAETELCISSFDYDGDEDVDLFDYRGFQHAFTGPPVQP